VRVPPLFPFSHRLSYAQFKYGRPSLCSKVLRPGERIELTVAVSNVSARRRQDGAAVRPRRKVAAAAAREGAGAFEKVAPEAGETRHLRIPLDHYAVGYFDTATGKWIAEEGRFEVLVGASAGDIK